MPRWEPDTPDRLAAAALELFVEKGFDATTVPEIAERAGLTTRSFFRHFADKREVLFLGADAIPAKVAALLGAAPPSLSVMETLTWGVEAIAREFFEGNRDALRIRRGIIAANRGLQERELRKQAEFVQAIADVLTQQGHDPITATVAGKVAVTLSSTSIGNWLDDPTDRPLIEHVHAVRQALTSVTTQ